MRRTNNPITASWENLDLIVIKLPAHFSSAHKLGKKPIVACFITDPTGDDSRVHLGFPGHLQDRHWPWVFQDDAVVPNLRRYQSILRQLVCFLFCGVVPTRFNPAQTVVIHEAWTLGQWCVEMILLKELCYQGEYWNR